MTAITLVPGLEIEIQASMAPNYFLLGTKIIYLGVIFKLLIKVVVSTVKLKIKHKHKYLLFIQNISLKFG